VWETHDTADRRLGLKREDVILPRDDEDPEVDLVSASGRVGLLTGGRTFGVAVSGMAAGGVAVCDMGVVMSWVRGGRGGERLALGRGCWRWSWR
jgi:hypothetical protein